MRATSGPLATALLSFLALGAVAGTWSAALAQATAAAGPVATAPAAAPPAAIAPQPLVPPAQALAQAEQAFAAARTQVQQLVALYRVDEAQRLVGPQAALAAVDQLQRRLDAASAEPLLAAELASVRAEVELRAGHGAAAAAIWRGLGEVERWQAVGPFDNSNPAEIATVAGPEHGVNLAAQYPGKQRTVRWRPMPYVADLGVLNLGGYLSPSQSASAYLVSWVRSPKAQPVALRLRDDGATRVWINGALVFDEEGSHPSTGFDQHAVGALLAPGWNEILAKAGSTQSADWHFSLRVTTPAGVPLVLADTDVPPPLAARAPRVQGAAPPAPAVADLTADAAAAAKTGGAAAELDYAWVLTEKKNFNAGGQDDANAFMAAIAGLPGDTQAVLDFVRHDTDQSRRYRYLEQLIRQAPGNAEAHLLLGTIELSRGEYWPARSEFETALGMTPGGILGDPPSPALAARGPQAALGLVEIYAGMEVRPEALAWAAALGEAGRQSALIAEPVALMLRRVGAPREALGWFASAHAADAGDLVASARLAQAQRVAGDMNGALATLRQASDLAGNPPGLMVEVARSLSGLGRAPEALAEIRRAVALAPDAPSLRVTQGEIERHFGHLAASRAAWQAALNLDPQDASLRNRLELASGGVAAQVASFERPYTQNLDQVIAAYKKQSHPGAASGPVVVLADTTVTNIFPSGNVGRYVQQIFRVNDTNGANSLAYYPVTYDPGTQSVHFLVARVVHPDGSVADAPQAGDVPVSQSVGYQTFYDVRNKYVQMPPIRPGDFVEIAYRVLPTTLESLYGNYYGDLDQFGGSAPTLFQQYVVITPSDKPLYFKAIRFHGQSSQLTRAGQTVYRWSARDLPAQVGEPLAPPEIERLPYIEVSSFRTWSQFARWYTQLIRDTFVMDSEMDQTVQRLVQGKTTERAKVDAIYRWVIQNTHYVALEFGIHGYRPYPVTQVFHRRFGDCKDKASLLIAMLHQAGINSDFVLVRVRELGLLDPSIASVADFDHAIVYVPSLHLYLDGTAEYNGADELPAGDQRAFVLRIPVTADLAADSGATAVPVADASGPQAGADPAAVAPLVTPEQPATANTISRMLIGQIDPQGELHFRLQWVLAGGEAPLFRESLAIKDRQAGALQAMLHTQLPGIDVTAATVVGENHWNQPLQVTMDGVIPAFATISGNTMLVPRQILPRAWLPQMASLARRNQNVLTEPPELLTEVMHLALPPGYRLGTLPGPTQMRQPFAFFQADATLNGSTLTLRSRLETMHSLIPPAEYPAFRTFWSQVDATLGRPVTARLSPQPPAADPAAPGSQL